MFVKRSRQKLELKLVLPYNGFLMRINPLYG
jgi:hypothetical protein